MELKTLLNSIFNHLLFRSFVVAVIVLLASTKSVTAGNGPIADLFVWNGSTNSDWATGSNWTITRGTTGTSNSYPGQTTATDSVTISNGGSPTVASGSYSVARLIINNLTGPIGGSTLTINSGATITVSGSGGATQGSPAVLLKGGNIVNNGTLTVTSTDASAPTYLIYFSSPTTLPGVATTYGYTGTGTLNLTNNVAGQISYGVMHTATNANTSYRFNVGGALNYTAPNGSYVLTVPENTISPLVIGGTGYTLGSVGSPVTLGLIRQNGGGTNVTVDTGTTLTLWSASGNTARGVYMICSATGPNATFTNKGTLSGFGTSDYSFIALSDSYVTPANTLLFDNQGTITTDMAVEGAFRGVFGIPNGATSNVATVHVTNSGSMTIKNTSGTANCGYALYVGNTNSVTATIDNTGTIDLNGALASTGAQVTTLNNNNNGVVNVRTSNLDKVIFNNNSGGTLDCISANVVSNSGASPSYVVTLAAGSTLKTAIAGGSTCLSGTGPVFNAAANYEFNGTVAQTTGASLTAASNISINNTAGVTLSTGIAVSGTFSVISNSILTCGTNVISGAGNFSLAAGTTLQTAKLTGINASITTAGSNTFNAAANYLFNGAAAQVTGTLLTTANNVEINNASGVTMSANTTVNGALTLTSGALTTGVYTLTLKGATSGSGTIDSGAAGTISYDGTSTQSISNLASNTARNLTINNTAGTSLATTSTVASTLTVNAGAKFVLSNPLTVSGNVILNASKTNAPSIVLTNGIAVSGTVTLRKTLDKQIWYFMSFPVDVAVNDISKFSGTTALTLNGNMWVKYYDGKGRAANLGASTNWVSVTAGQTLLANKGYIFGIADALDAGDYVLSIPLANSIVASAEGTRGVSVGIYGKDTIAAAHAGWNLAGIPYMSNFNGTGVGANYITVFNGSSYDQYAKAALATIQPYSSFFIQASTTNLTFDLANRQTVKSAVSTNAADQVQINVSTETGTDFTTLIIDESQSPAYEINQDLGKWLTLGTSRPQLYTVLEGMNYAFNALPRSCVQDLPVGMYTLKAGTSKISADVSQAPGLIQLLLTDKVTGTVTDLLASDYSFTATAGTSNNRFYLSANRDIQTSSSVEQVDIQPTVLAANGKLIVRGVLEYTSIRVYDMMGKMVENVVSNTNYMEIPIPVKGVYCVQLQSNGKCWNRKISL